MPDTIFMIHCMCGGAWTWDNYKTFFEEKGYECVTTNLRYHDAHPDEEPDPRLGTTSLLDYADDLEKEIKKLDEKPILVGHSMGGLFSQILASRGIVESAVLLAPASPAGINSLKPSVIKSFLSMQMQWGFWKKPVKQTFDEAVYSMLHKLPENKQREIYNRFVYESGRAASEIGYWFFDPNNASKVDESKVTCPVLVIVGSEDRITPVSVVRKVAEKYEHVSTYKEFEGHGHWLPGEPGWEDIAGFVTEWIGNN